MCNTIYISGRNSQHELQAQWLNGIASGQSFDSQLWTGPKIASVADRTETAHASRNLVT
jgi:hypothetical protein